MTDDRRGVAGRPRYSDAPLPPYSYVPGAAPHPISDPRGHMFGAVHAPTSPLDPAAWQDSREYRVAVDLFNHGFYWEAHEAWESLWHAAGRTGQMAAWLKALIKLAAAGVKAREGNPAGVRRHAARALELVGQVRTDLSTVAVRFCGVDLDQLERIAGELQAMAEANFGRPNAALILPHWIELGSA